jgi:toxin HigB-1
MDVEFAKDNLRLLYTQADRHAGFSTDIIRAYRRKMQLVVNAKDERDLRNWKSLHYKQLKGPRKHQWSLRLNGPWRLILEKQVRSAKPTLVVVAIENDH